MAFAFYNSLSNLSINYNVGFGTSTPLCPLHSTVIESHMGNVGIGTTNPLQRLHVTGGSACFINTNVGIGVTNPAAAIDVLASSTNALTINQQGTSFNALNVATTNNANTMCVSGIGQVGINTATPVQALHVEGNQVVRGRIGAGLNITTPTATLHVSGTTSGVPGVYSSGLLSGNIFIFTLQPNAYKVHEIRFNYYSPTGNGSHSATLSCPTAALINAYSMNIGTFTVGSTWNNVNNNQNQTAGPTIPFALTANQSVNGVITIYNHDIVNGSANVAIDILTPVPSRIFGGMKIYMSTNGNIGEFRYTISTPNDCVGSYTITGYPL